MKQKRVFLFLIILLLIGLFSSSIFAADVVGTVKDNDTGLPISNVIVKILETGDSTMTDNNGNYFMPNVIDGSYTFLVGALNFVPLNITRTVGSCCFGIRGNVNNDIGDLVDISDLVFLVGFMFQSGAAAECFEEADVNGSATIDISDLVFLVSYMFQSGPPPVSCI